MEPRLLALGAQQLEQRLALRVARSRRAPPPPASRPARASHARRRSSAPAWPARPGPRARQLHRRGGTDRFVRILERAPEGLAGLPRLRLRGRCSRPGCRSTRRTPAAPHRWSAWSHRPARRVNRRSGDQAGNPRTPARRALGRHVANLPGARGGSNPVDTRTPQEGGSKHVQAPAPQRGRVPRPHDRAARRARRMWPPSFRATA